MREWALVERQRIVAERDSVRSMCDELRRDRDGAVTKLADAFRCAEQLQRHKELADRELLRLRSRRAALVGRSASRTRARLAGSRATASRAAPTTAATRPSTATWPSGSKRRWPSTW